MAKTRMVKKKKNGKRSVPKPRRNVAIPRPGVNSSIALKRNAKMNHHHTVCSVTDPFCVHARNAQCPDGGPPTVPFQLRQLITVTADAATGTARYVFVPGIKYLYGAYGTVSTNWDGGASWVQGGQTFTENASEVRIVSFGCIVRSAMTATTAKGSVILSVDPAPILNAQQIVKGGMNGAEVVVIPLAAGMEHSWRSKPLANHKLLRPYTQFTSTNTDFDWTSLVVEVVGSDISSAIPYVTVEYVCNIEFTVRAGIGGSSSTNAGIAQLARAPARPNPVALKAADVVHTTAPSFIEGGITRATNFLEKQAMSALDSIMSEGLAFLSL